MSALVYILVGLSLTLFSTFALGTLLLRRLGLTLDPLEDWLFRFFTGSALWSLTVFALASVGLIYKATFYVLGVLAMVVLYRYRLPRVRISWHWSAIPYAVFGVFYLGHALAPEMSPDGMSYHLGLVARYAREHGFRPFSTNMYAYLSQGLEMLFLSAFTVGRHSAAALVHFCYLLALPPLLAVHAGRTGFLAGLFVFLLPVTGIDGISAYNDVALAVVAFAVFHAVTRSKATENPAWITVAALLVGFAFSIKFTGFVFAAFLLPAWRLFPRWQWAWVCALPWLVKNYLWCGNPLAPFFNQWFENQAFTAEFETGYREFLRHYDLSGPREWLTEVLLGGPRLSGLLGPAGVLLPVSLLGLARQRMRPLLLAGLAALCVYPLNLGTRFLLPALPFFSLALLQMAPRLGVVLIPVAAVLSWPAVLNLYSPPSAWRLEKIPWRAALRIETEDGFLTRKRASYITARLIEQTVPVGESVFAFSPIPESYTSRNVLIAYQSALGLRLQQALIMATYEGYQARFLYHCPANELRIEEDTADVWSIVEIEPRPSGITCSRMPWDRGLAVDGLYASRWRSGRSARKGDFCQLSGKGPWRVWGSADQWGVKLAGCQREVVAANADYRADARRYALSQGIRWLAIDEPDFAAKDFREHADLWQVELVAQRGSMRLYRFRN